MSTSIEIFVGIIAVATLATAVAQIAVLIAAGLLARRIGRLVDHVERELTPMFEHLNAISRDAARTVSLASAQVERADRLFTDVAGKIEQTLNNLQTTLVAPAREGRAVLAGFFAVIRAVRDLRQQTPGRQARSEDEDALFI